jgi:hypothetical protein
MNAAPAKQHGDHPVQHRRRALADQREHYRDDQLTSNVKPNRVSLSRRIDQSSQTNNPALGTTDL